MADDEDRSDMTPVPRPAARVLLLDAKDRCLLFSWKPPNVWITPGGGLEPGDTYEQAALRELLEETGLSIRALAMLARVVHFDTPLKLTSRSRCAPLE